MIQKLITLSAIYFFLFASCSHSVKFPEDSIQLSQYYIERMQEFSNEPNIPGGIIFLGDSITEGGDWKQLTGNSTVINRGINGDNTKGVLTRLYDIFSRQPAKLFILIGVNDIAKNIPGSIVADNYRKIITIVKTHSPGTLIYLQSILPLNSEVYGFPKGYDKQSQVIATNQLLEQMAISMNIVYADIYPLFLNGDQKMDVKYTTDGLHLNNNGYQKWVSFLKSHNFL